MNGSSHPNHENRLVTSVPRFKASPRYGRARRFQHFFSHINRRGVPCFGAVAFIAMVNDDPSLIISDYHDFHKKSSEKQTIAPGGSGFSCFRPHRSGIPLVAITPHKAEIISKKEGVKGMLPLSCFPLRGGEGVILQAAAENKRIETKEDSTRAYKP
jgi:hypothetical protein